MNAATSQQTPAALHSRFDALDSLRRYGIAVVFAILVVTMVITSPQFRTKGNFLNLLQQNAIIGILACGMTFAIILGGFDLSVGANAAMCSVVAAKVMIDVDIGLGIVAALVAGLTVGIVNGDLDRLCRSQSVRVDARHNDDHPWPRVRLHQCHAAVRGRLLLHPGGIGTEPGGAQPILDFRFGGARARRSAGPDPVWSPRLRDWRERRCGTADGYQCQANAAHGLCPDRYVCRHFRDHPGWADRNRPAGRGAELRADRNCRGDHWRGNVERRIWEPCQHHHRRVSARGCFERAQSLWSLALLATRRDRLHFGRCRCH